MNFIYPKSIIFMTDIWAPLSQIGLTPTFIGFLLVMVFIAIAIYFVVRK